VEEAVGNGRKRGKGSKYTGGGGAVVNCDGLRKGRGADKTVGGEVLMTTLSLSFPSRPVGVVCRRCLRGSAGTSAERGNGVGEGGAGRRGGQVGGRGCRYLS